MKQAYKRFPGPRDANESTCLQSLQGIFYFLHGRNEPVRTGSRRWMKNFKLPTRVPFFPLTIAVSLLVGWFIPEFYVWTGSNQSSPSPLLWTVPLWSAIVSAVLCMALPWLPIKTSSSSDTSRTPMRFSVRALLMLTAGVAVAIPLLAKFPLVVSGIVCAGAFAYLIAFCVRNPQHRMAATALVACMIMPFAWLVGYGELDRLLPALVAMFAGMPAIVPAALLSQMVGQPFQESQWLAFLITAFELVIGIWMIRLGLKRTIAYLLLVLHLSAVGSLGFHMACLA